MNAILPKDIEAFAQAEVEAGRAASVEAWLTTALRAHRDRMVALRKSLDDAEQEAADKGILSLDEAFALADARLAARS